MPILPPFEDMMREVDQSLSSNGIYIPHRPNRARLEIQERYGIPIPYVLSSGFDAKSLPWEEMPFGHKIDVWYQETYGERLKMRGALGKIVVRMGYDIWAVRIPRVIGGGIRFHVKRDISEANISTANVVRFVENLTVRRASWLSDIDLEFLMTGFTYGLHALYLLEHNRRHELGSVLNQLFDLSEV